MDCPQCGNRLKPKNRFCDRCGCQIYPNGFHSDYNSGNDVVKWILAITTAAISLVAIIVLIFMVPSKTASQENSETIVLDESEEFNLKVLPEFVFDDIPIAEYSGDTVVSPAVEAVAPVSGTVGTKVLITGSDFAGVDLKKVMLGESELSIYSVSQDIIEVHIPYGAKSGNISLMFSNETVDAGHFDVVPQTKKLLLEQEINPSNNSHLLSTDELSIIIPGNSLRSPQTVKIEQINNPQPINLPDSVKGTAFSITAGDVHEFNDVITIEYILPDNVNGEPSAAYYNEETSLWDTLPSEVVDGRLLLYTNHLTDFFIYYWGKAIYSPEGNFKIYYNQNDKFNYGSSMDDLALKVGQTLEKARKDYDAKIPAEYCEDFLYMGFKDAMDVYLDDSYGDGKYAALTNNICLMTNYRNQDDFETMLAHELFHAYQDSVWNELGIIGKMGKSENKWAIEALAELAAYELAFPEKKRQRLLTDGVCSENPYNTVDMVHEYNMSCFLRYLLRKTNSTFEEMWTFVVRSNKISLDVSLSDFFKSKSNNFISLEMSYMDFWRDVIGLTDAPMHKNPEILFAGRKMYFQPNQHTAQFRYQTDSPPTTAFNLFAAKAFSSNMPVRIFNVECINSSNNRIMCTQLSGIKNPSDLNTKRTNYGYYWNYLYSEASLGNTNQLYYLKSGKGDMVIVGLESVQKNTLYSAKISEIQAKCKPKQIEKVVPGTEHEFAVAFRDIFSYVTEVELEIDLGDGLVKRFRKNIQNRTLSGTIKHTFGEISRDAVTFSLYDVSKSNRDLISRLVIPMSIGEVMPEPIIDDDSTEESPDEDTPETTDEPDDDSTEPNQMDEPSESNEADEPPEETSKLYGKWRGIFDYMGYIEGYYFAETIQFNADGTFSSYFSAVSLDGSSEIPLDEEYTKDEGPFVPKSGTFTFDESTSQGTAYYTYLEYSKTFDFKYENDQLTCGDWKFNRIE